jgi:undecaprenyl-diphosphatase
MSRGISLGEVPGALVAMVFAIGFGIVSIRLMKKIVEAKQYGNFAYYCWVIGVVSLLLTFIF